jgi:hypothetical protein
VVTDCNPPPGDKPTIPSVQPGLGYQHGPWQSAR